MDRSEGSEPRDDEHDDGDSPERAQKERGTEKWAAWARRAELILRLLAAGANTVTSFAELVDLLSRLL